MFLYFEKVVFLYGIFKDWSIYEKEHLLRLKLHTKLSLKVFLQIVVVLNIKNNILKIQENLSTEKLLFSRWRPRWPPFASNGNKSFIIYPRDMILVSTPMFWRSRNSLRPVKVQLNDQVFLKSKMASNMAGQYTKMTITNLIFTLEFQILCLHRDFMAQ